MAMGSVPGSPSFSDSSGGSDLMALLDRELEDDVVEAGEQDNMTSATEMWAENYPVQLETFSTSHSEQPVSCRCPETETCTDGRQNKRQRLGPVQQQCPPHPGMMHGMCIRCGAEVSEPDQPGIPLRYLHLGLQVSSQEAERIRSQHLHFLLSKKKLLLVLDLDHTLLVSTRMADLPEDMLAKAEELLAEQGPGEQQMLFKLPHMLMWTKLRPGIREFLIEAHKLFELHIYTHGDQDYAAEMAKLLDPKKTLFGGRVISGRDSTQKNVKNLDVVLGADTSVLILDDTEGVWPQHVANLIQVDRYIFFPACATRFGRSHKCLLEKGQDEDADKGMLSTALQVLQQVHKTLFQAPQPNREDVRHHLQQLRRQVLAGVHLVFSHVIPLEQDVTQHPIWQLAAQLGATCHATVSDDVTHVVSSAQDTDKMHWAKRHNRHRVSVNWLYMSGFHWKRAQEAKYPVDNNKAAVVLPNAVDDTAAAIAGAGGGRGLMKDGN